MFLMKALTAVGVMLLPIMLLGYLVVPRRSADEALQEFYAHDGPEITQMDPLILAGDEVVPLILEKVKDKNMPKRRYAIAFLGNGRYPQALPVLESILRNDTEEDLYRGDALQAIYLINNDFGSKFARQCQKEKNYLGMICNDLITKRQLLPDHRSYLAALSSRLD